MASNAAVAALLKPTYQHGRNNFPLDNKHTYSMKAGQLQPVKCFHYEPESHFNIKAHDFTMTFPMQTAPFLRGRKEFAFYSVYYNAVWSLYNQYQGTRNDPKTSAFGNSPKLQEPRISKYELYFAVYYQWLGLLAHDVIIPHWVRLQSANFVDQSETNIQACIKLAQKSYLGFGYDDPLAIETIFCTFIEPDTSSSYTLSGNNQYHISLNNGCDPSLRYKNDFNDLSFAEYLQDIVGHFRAYSWMRKLDMLGYGNLYPVFRYYHSLLETLCDGTNTMSNVMTSFNTALDGLMEYLFKICYTYRGTISAPEDEVPVYVNLYPICAYNSVFYHFFRNSYYDLDYDPSNYNLDFVSTGNTDYGTFNTVTMNDFYLRFLDIEYHQWKKDTFTGVLPDSQFGAVSQVTLSGNFVTIPTTGTDLGRWRYYPNQQITSDHSIVTESAGNLKDSVNNSVLRHSHDVNINVDMEQQNVGFNVIALKRAEMLQDYRQQLMRAGNKTSDVFRAIYGGSPSSEHEDDVIPRFLETFGEDLFVDPVLSTADTNTGDNGKLGDIAARGKFRGDSSDIKFNAGYNFGLIICFAYIVPTAEYNSYMMDKHVLELSPEAHFLPQFENAGLEQVVSDELNMLLPANSNYALGFAPRYYHKKSEVDMVHGAFCSLPGGSAFVPIPWYGDFNNWVSPRTDLQNRQTTSVRDFYINPSVLDNIFVRAAGPDQSDDQFICNTYFEVNAIKGMSKVGLIDFV